MEGVNGQELSHRHELSNYVATHSGDDSPTGIIQALMIRVFRGTCITWIQQSSVKFSGDGSDLHYHNHSHYSNPSIEIMSTLSQSDHETRL